MRGDKVLWLAVTSFAVSNVAWAQSGGVVSRPGQLPAGNSSNLAPRAKFEPAGDRVYHGASVPGTWDASALTRQVQQYQQYAGKRLSVVTWFASAYEQGRLTSWRTNYASALQRVKKAGALSLIKFSVQDDAYNANKRIAKTSDIARGVYDPYFHQFADTIKDFGDPVFISINHEMNGTWFPFSEGFPGSGVTAQDFVASWKRIVDIFRQRGANNVAWVWSPNVPDVGPVPFTRYYPGDDYVDWIGVSFYSGNPMSNLKQIYATYSAKKPLFVTEWATSPEKNQYYQGFPGEAKWVANFFAALETNYPRVKAISWFQWDKSDGNHLLQRVPAQAQTYAAEVKNPRYVETPDGLGQSTSTGPERPPLQVVPQEIVLQAVPRVENPQPKAPPRQRLKLQVVPTEKVAIQR
jgi:hypothetical protein